MPTPEIAAEDVGLAFVARPRSTVAAAVLDDEAVLFDEATGRLHTLDRIATVVWECLDGSARLRDIASELAHAFGADSAVVEADVLGLVRALGRQGVLEGVAADPEALEEPMVEEEVLVPDGDGNC